MKKRSASDTRHADKRRDLARELIPQDARRAYLHPSKRGLPGTLFRMYLPILKNPRIILSALLYALSAGLLPLLGVLVVQHLAGLLASPGATAGSMFTAAGLYAASFFLLSTLSRYCCVVARFLCPTSSCTVRESVPASSCRVQYVCLLEW